jgi:hypothetical protein
MRCPHCQQINCGDYKASLGLGKQPSPARQLRLALTGEVHSKVDAHYTHFDVADLLTTLPTSGRTMKATEPLKGF